MNSIEKNSMKEILIVLATAIVLIATYRVTLEQFNVEIDDYTVHAANAIQQGVIPEGNVEFLWHSLVASVYKLIPGIPVAHAASFVSAVVNSMAYLAILNYLNRYHKQLNNCVSFVALCLMFVGPLYIPWFNENYYFGQIVANTWHNPTNLTVKPFAILSFTILVSILEDFREEKIDNKKLVWLSAIVFFSCIAKPSWIQIAIPALGIYLIVLLMLKRNKETFILCLKIALSFVPAVLVLLIQVLAVFGGGQDGSGPGIAIDPFYTWSRCTNNILVSVLISISFPITVTVCNLSKIKDVDLKLSFLLFFSGFMEYAFLVEDGPRRNDGNFGWGLAISVLLLHIVSTNKLLTFTESYNKTRSFDKWKLRLQWLMLFINVWFGVRYYNQLVEIQGMWL